MSQQPDMFNHVYTHSRLQDRALAICLATQTRCDFGCERGTLEEGGAPNCHYWASRGDCAPGRQAIKELWG